MRIGFEANPDLIPTFDASEVYDAYTYVKRGSDSNWTYYRLKKKHNADVSWSEFNTTTNIKTVDLDTEPGLRYTASGVLDINGKITADSGRIGGWIIGT